MAYYLALFQLLLLISVSAAELKKIKLNMDNMFNEKVRVEKSEKGKKSKGKGKAKLKVEGDNMVSFISCLWYPIAIVSHDLPQGVFQLSGKFQRKYFENL